MTKFKNREGEIHITNQGYTARIIKYTSFYDCDVLIEEHNLIISKVCYREVVRGKIKCKLHRSVHNRGYIGEGIYSSSLKNKQKTEYKVWKSMMDRCYNTNIIEKHPTYKDCMVHPKWHNFQNFAAWFEKNYVEGWHLDKDISLKGNKIYAPETCCFVPKEVNELFRDYTKKSKLPVGVSKHSKKYRSRPKINGEVVELGYFQDSNEAFYAYKKVKEGHIKEVADKWKDQIDEKVYEAMYGWSIEKKPSTLKVCGSMAISYHYPDFPRIPKDIDYFTEKSCKSPIVGVELLKNPLFFKHSKNVILSPNEMLSLKISHLFWDFNWEKTMYDVQFLLKKGCTYDLDLLNKLKEYWTKVLPKIRRSELAQGKDDFFTNNINEDVDQHDKYHYILEEIPAFTKLLKDGAEVELDESKWDKLSFEEKCDVVFEEAAVMAFERYPKMDYRRSYKKQLKDNIIKHYPEYIAIFAVVNYIKLEKPKYNFKIKLENGIKKD